MRSFITEQLASRIADEVLREAYYGPPPSPSYSYPQRDFHGNPLDAEDYTPFGGPVTYDDDGNRIVNPYAAPEDQYVVPERPWWVLPGGYEEDYINPYKPVLIPPGQVADDPNLSPHGPAHEVDQFPWQYYPFVQDNPNAPANVPGGRQPVYNP
jgi:hypothetical protein